MRKKIIVAMIVATLTLGSSLSAYAACGTHFVGDSPNWEYIGILNARSGGTHSYPVVVTESGKVLKWGTCQDVIYKYNYGARCVHCNNYVIYKTEEHTVHSPQ